MKIEESSYHLFPPTIKIEIFNFHISIFSPNVVTERRNNDKTAYDTKDRTRDLRNQTQFPVSLYQAFSIDIDDDNLTCMTVLTTPRLNTNLT